MGGGVPWMERHVRARQALDQVGLGEKLYYKPGQLSGGQAQRIIRLEDGHIVYDGDAHVPEAVVRAEWGKGAGA